MGRRNGLCRKDERLGAFHCHESKQVVGSFENGRAEWFALKPEKLNKALGLQSRASSPGRRQEASFGRSPLGVRVGSPRLWEHPFLARNSTS